MNRCRARRRVAILLLAASVLVTVGLLVRGAPDALSVTTPPPVPLWSAAVTIGSDAAQPPVIASDGATTAIAWETAHAGPLKVWIAGPRNPRGRVFDVPRPWPNFIDDLELAVGPAGQVVVAWDDETLAGFGCSPHRGCSCNANDGCSWVVAALLPAGAAAFLPGVALHRVSLSGDDGLVLGFDREGNAVAAWEHECGVYTVALGVAGAVVDRHCYLRDADASVLAVLPSRPTQVVYDHLHRILSAPAFPGGLATPRTLLRSPSLPGAQYRLTAVTDRGGVRALVWQSPATAACLVGATRDSAGALSAQTLASGTCSTYRVAGNRAGDVLLADIVPGPPHAPRRRPGPPILHVRQAPAGHAFGPAQVIAHGPGLWGGRVAVAVGADGLGLLAFDFGHEVCTSVVARTVHNGTLGAAARFPIATATPGQIANRGRCPVLRTAIDGRDHATLVWIYGRYGTRNVIMVSRATL